MTPRARRPMPNWFLALVALVCWWLLHATPAATAPAPAPLQYAFWGWIILVAQAIWAGAEVVGQVSLAVLGYAVQALWMTLRLFYNTALEIGKGAMVGFRASWAFLKAAYDDVLKPGWTKFWMWIDRARKWLDSFFKPVFDFLYAVRQQILDFYDQWIRPILDAIDIARKVLNVLSSLGVEWAKALDAKLAWLEAKINEPFLYALGKINEVIGIVDRIVTANGLFQRLALIKSIERDIKYIHDRLIASRLKPLDSHQIGVLAKATKATPMPQLIADLTAYTYGARNEAGDAVDAMIEAVTTAAPW